ncbi:uncharacterized protein [Diabrotica undecimpunctata]|uniref:uncharacterized protein n=1 Tax=Diabrotica undecimpunctata TaxID=50387 RepID=UPI003B6424E7
MESGERRKKHRHRESNIEIDHKKIKDKKRRHHRRKTEERNVENSNGVSKNNQPNTESGNSVKKNKDEIHLKYNIHGDNIVEIENVKKETKDHKHRKHKASKENRSTDRQIVEKHSEYKNKSNKKQFAQSKEDNYAPSVKGSLQKCKTFHLGENCQHRPRSSMPTKLKEKEEKKPRAKSDKRSTENKVSEIWYCHIDNTEPFKESAKNQEYLKAIRGKVRQNDKHYVKERAKSSPENIRCSNHQHRRLSNVTKFKNDPPKEHTKSVLNITNKNVDKNNNVEEMIGKECSRTIEHNLKSYFVKIEKLIDQKLNTYLQQKNTTVTECLEGKQGQSEKEKKKDKRNHRNRESIIKKRNMSASSESSRNDNGSRKLSVSPTKLHQRSRSMFAANVEISPSNIEKETKKQKTKFKEKIKSKERSKSGKRENLHCKKKLENTEEDYKNINFEKVFIRPDIRPEEKENKVRKNKIKPELAVPIPNSEGQVAAPKFIEDVQETCRYYPDKHSEIRERRLKSRHRSKREDSLHLPTQPDPTPSKNYTREREYDDSKHNRLKLSPTNYNKNASMNILKEKYRVTPTGPTNLVESTRHRDSIEKPSTSIVYFKPIFSSENIPSLSLDSQDASRINYFLKQPDEENMPCQRYSQRPGSYCQRKTNFIVEGIEPAKRLNATKAAAKNTSLKKNFECKTVSVITIPPHNQSNKYIPLEEEGGNFMENSNKMKRLKLYYQCSLDSNKCSGSNFSEDQSIFNESLKILSDFSDPNRDLNETQTVKKLPVKHKDSAVKDSSSMLLPTRCERRNKFNDNDVSHGFNNYHSAFSQSNCQNAHIKPSIPPHRLYSPDRDIKSQQGKRKIKKHLQNDANLKSKSDINLFCKSSEDNSALQKKLILLDGLKDNKNLKLQEDTALFNLKVLKNALETQNMLSKEQFPNKNNQILQHLENMYHIYLATLSQANNEVNNKNLNVPDDQVVTTQQDVTKLHQKVEKLVKKADKIDERLNRDIADKQLHPGGNNLSHHDDKNILVDLENCKYKTVDTSYHNLNEDNQAEHLTKITYCQTEINNPGTKEKLITTSDKVTSYHELTCTVRKEDSNNNSTDASYYISHNSIATSTETTKEKDKIFKSNDSSIKVVKTVMTANGLKGKENKANCASNVTPEELVPRSNLVVEKVDNQIEEDHYISNPTNVNITRKITETKEMSHTDTVCTIEIQTNNDFIMSQVPCLEKKEIGVKSLIKHKKPLTRRPGYIEETPKTPKKTSRIPQCLNKLPKQAQELNTVDNKCLDIQDITKDEQSLYKLKDKPGDIAITNLSQHNKDIYIKNELKEEVRDPAIHYPRKHKENSSNVVPSTRIPRKIKQHSAPTKEIKTIDNHGGEYLLKKSQSEISLRKLNSGREKGRTSSLICLHRYVNNPNLADSSNSGMDSFYLGRSVAIEPNITSRLLLTKDYKPPQMSSYQRRKIYDKNIRSKLKKKMYLHEKKVRQIFEVRYLTLGKNMEASNPKILNKIPENSTGESIERSVDEFMEETLRLLVKNNSENLLTFVQENIDIVKRLNVVELLRRLADSAECSKLQSKINKDTSKEVVNFFIALNHCLRAFANFETFENSATHVKEAVSSNDSTIVPSSETYSISKQSGITRNCSCRTIEPSDSSCDFLYQDDDNQNLVEQKINFNPILGFTFKHNSNIKQTETGSFVESYNSEESGYVSSEKSKHDPLTFFKRPIMAELLRPRAELFGNTSSCYEMKNESTDTIKEDIAPSTTSYYPYAELCDSLHVNAHPNNLKDVKYMIDMNDKDDNLIFETVQMSTNISLKRYSYPQYYKNEDTDKLLELVTQKRNSCGLKLKKSISNADFTPRKEEFTIPKRTQSEMAFPKYSQIGVALHSDDKCKRVFQSMPLFKEIIENDCLEDIVVLKKLLDPGVYLLSTNFNSGYITLHIDTEEQNTTNINSSLFYKNLLLKYDSKTCSCISDVKKLTTMKFFENLLHVYEKEAAFSFKLFGDNSYLENELFSVVAQIKQGKGKGKISRKMRFFFKNIFFGKPKVKSKLPLDNGNEVIYPLDESFQKSFQILADYAVKQFSQLSAAVWTNFEKNDEYNIYGLLTLLHKIKSGHFTFIKVSKLTNIEEEMKNQLKQAFHNVYLKAYNEAYHLQRKLSDNDIKLAGALVCKYRAALLIQDGLVASYLGKGFFENELELKASVIYIMKVLSSITELEDFENFRRNTECNY